MRCLAQPLRGSTTTKRASDSTTRPNRLHNHTHSPRGLAHPRSPMPPLSTLTARATHALPLHPAALASAHMGMGLCLFESEVCELAPAPAWRPALCIWGVILDLAWWPRGLMALNWPTSSSGGIYLSYEGSREDLSTVTIPCLPRHMQPTISQ